MNTAELFKDLVVLVQDSVPLPDFATEEEVKVWVGKLSADTVSVIYDFVEKQKLMGVEGFEKIGDGKILKMIQEYLPLVLQIVAMFTNTNPAK